MTQVYDSEMEQHLAATFQRRYEPQFAWGNAVSAMFLLNNIKAIWPMTSRHDYVQYDISGQGRALAASGNPQIGYSGLLQYQILTGNDYLYRPDESGLGVTTYQTTGGWFRFNTLTGTLPLITQWNGATNQRGFTLYYSGGMKYAVSTTGANQFTATHAAVLSTGVWYHMVGQFKSSTQDARVFVNGIPGTDAAVGAGSIFDSTEDFRIGMHNGAGGSIYFDGDVSMCWFCGQQLSDVMIWALYQVQRPIFGV